MRDIIWSSPQWEIAVSNRNTELPIIQCLIDTTLKMTECPCGLFRHEVVIGNLVGDGGLCTAFSLDNPAVRCSMPIARHPREQTAQPTGNSTMRLITHFSCIPCLSWVCLFWWEAGFHESHIFTQNFFFLWHNISILLISCGYIIHVCISIVFSLPHVSCVLLYTTP